ncbi:MAG: hypothetical protein IJU48_01585 [Synergistaceae bacterium]|nr:hypothetical protein [Synergistaceae bacterium]
MNAVNNEKNVAVDDELSEGCEYFSDEEVAEMTDAIIEKHREALTALANA